VRSGLHVVMQNITAPVISWCIFLSTCKSRAVSAQPSIALSATSGVGVV
jgi:hypothetical protein